MNELVEEWLALHHGYTRQSYENTINQFSWRKATIRELKGHIHLKVPDSNSF